MDGSYETAYASPTVKTEERWGREDMVGGRQGPTDSYRGRRSPGKTLDLEKLEPSHFYYNALPNYLSPLFTGPTYPQEMALLFQDISSILSPNLSGHEYYS